MIDVRGTGCTGYEVAAALRASYDIYVELATHATLVLVLGLGQPVDALCGSRTTSPRPSGGSPGPARHGRLTARCRSSGHETVISPREAFLGEGEMVPVDQAIGRISCESIAGYPPGVPSLLPGERVTAEVVAYLRELTAGRRAAARRGRPGLRHAPGARRAEAKARSGGGARSTRASSLGPRRRAASPGSFSASWLAIPTANGS